MMQKRLGLAWLLVVLLLLAHNANLWLVQRIVPDTDILALLPVQERDPILQQSFSHMVDAAQQRVVVLVGAPDWADAKRAAEAYGAVLATRTDLLSATQITDQTEGDWLAQFKAHSLVLMTPAQQEMLRTQPAQYWTETALAKMSAPFGGPKIGAWRDDPFGLFGDWLQQRAQETPVRPRDGKLFVADSDKQYVLIPITLKLPAFSITAQRAVVPLLAQAAAAARKAVPQAEVISAGVVLHAAAAGEQASGEVSTIGIGSLLGIVLLMWLTFRSLRPVGLILLSIGIGSLGALSVCWLLFGRVHLLTLVFGASLIGVAQDYGIYYLCHRLNADPALDSRTLLRRLMPGLLLTLITTVIGYMGLALTPFPGLRQMAVFSGLGLIFAWLTVICWFPLLAGGGSLSTGALVRHYGALLPHWPLLRWNRATLAALLAFAALALFGMLRLGVNDDIRLLQNSPQHLIDDQIKLGKLLDAPTPVQFYLVRGASAEVVLQREEALKLRLDGLIAQRQLGGYQAMSNWVPSARTQQERRALLDQKMLNNDGPLAQLAAQLGEERDWIATERNHLADAGKLLTPDEFLRSPASEPWRHLWLGAVDGQFASIVALRGVARGSLPLLQRTASGLDGVQWVDKVNEISSVLGRYRAQMAWVILGGYAVVFALMFPRYRRNTWRVLMPTALASVATLVVLGLLSTNLQLFHVLALMLLLGVGVDYGIFLHEHPGQRDTTPWLAVGLSGASTILSFGLLALSHTPALHAFGLTMLIGTTLVWILAPCFGKKTTPHAHH
jgi:predicted exporter